MPIALSALSAECIGVLKIYCALSAECTPDRALSVQVPSAAEHCVWAWCLARTLFFLSWVAMFGVKTLTAVLTLSIPRRFALSIVAPQCSRIVTGVNKVLKEEPT